MERRRNVNRGRRTFLYSSGGAALAVPFLRSLAPRSAHAAATGPQAKRFIAIQSYSGQIAKEWYPTVAPAGYKLKDAMFPGTPKADGTVYLGQRIPGYPQHSWAPLADFAGAGLSNILGASLNAHLPKINLLRGIDLLTGGSHGDGVYLGNYAACSSKEVYSVVAAVPTIDQVMAYSSKFYPTAPKRRALHLGTGSPNTMSYTNYGMANGKVEQASAFLDPAKAWDDLFRDFMSPSMPKENPNRSLVNAIHGDFARVSAGPRLSAADKQTLDRHMTFLADIERGLAARPQAACTAPPKPRSIENGYPWQNISSIKDFQDTISLMADVAVAAIRCDLTRIVTFNVQEALFDTAGTMASSYHNSADVQGDWHQFAHDQSSNAASRRNFVAISKWIASAVFGALLDRLDVDEGGGRTYLDNSLVVWGNELGYDHYSTDIQTVMAGSAGGALKTGYFVEYMDWSQKYANPIDGWGVLSPGVPHNRWLVTMLQAMGLQPADYERDGKPGYGYGTIISSPYNWPGYASPQLGTPLPGITA